MSSASTERAQETRKARWLILLMLPSLRVFGRRRVCHPEDFIPLQRVPISVTRKINRSDRGHQESIRWRLWDRHPRISEGSSQS